MPSRLYSALALTLDILAPALVFAGALGGVLGGYLAIQWGEPPFAVSMITLAATGLATVAAVTWALSRVRGPARHWLARHLWQSALGYLLMVMLLVLGGNLDNQDIAIVRLEALLMITIIAGNVTTNLWLHRRRAVAA